MSRADAIDAGHRLQQHEHVVVRRKLFQQISIEPADAGFQFDEVGQHLARDETMAV